MSAQSQFEIEMENLINRYSKEADLTIGEVLGAIEIVKARLLRDLFKLDDE